MYQYKGPLLRITALTTVLAMGTEVNQMNLGKEIISPGRRSIYTDTSLLAFLGDGLFCPH